MADKFLYIPNDCIQNYSFCRLELIVETSGHLNVLTNQSKFNEKPLGLSSQRIRKHYHKTLGTSEINSLMSAQSLIFVQNLFLKFTLEFRIKLLTFYTVIIITI